MTKHPIWHNPAECSANLCASEPWLQCGNPTREPKSPTLSEEIAMNPVARSASGFLDSLSADDFEAIRPNLRTVELSQERLLIEAGDAIEHVYLPHSGVVSHVVALEP